MYLAGYIVAGFIVAGFIVAGVYARAHLKGRRDRYHRTGLVVALSFAALAAPVQAIVGDWAMLSSAGVAVPLMLIFEAPVTRIVGVLGLFTFIVSGVFMIADPAFLGSEEEDGS